MQFTKFLTTVALASLVIAANIPRSDNVAARAVTPAKSPVKAPAANANLVAGTGAFKNVKGSKKAWADLAAGHHKGGKREIESRTVPAGYLGVEVSQGTHSSQGSIPLGLYTEGLVTCLGIVIKGVAPAGSNADTRWLLHMQATSNAGDWTPFEARVTAAGLTQMQGYMSVPTTTAVGTQVGWGTWTQDDQTLESEVIAAMTAAITTLTGRAPIIHQRTIWPATSMQIDGDGTVKAAGHTL